MTLDLAGQETKIRTMLDGDDVIPVLVTENDGITPASITGATVTLYVLNRRGELLAAALLTVAGVIVQSGITDVGEVNITVTQEAKRAALNVSTFFYVIMLHESAGADTPIRHGPYQVIS